jgi:hypothetical protein
MELRQQIHAGEADFATAYRYDVDLATTHHDCWIEINGESRRNAIIDEFANQFAKEKLNLQS